MSKCYIAAPKLLIHEIEAIAEHFTHGTHELLNQPLESIIWEMWITTKQIIALQQHKLMTETFFFLMRFSHLQFPVNKNK